MTNKSTVWPNVVESVCSEEDNVKTPRLAFLSKKSSSALTLVKTCFIHSTFSPKWAPEFYFIWGYCHAKLFRLKWCRVEGIKFQKRGGQNKVKYHRCLPLTVEVLPCYSNKTLALLPFFPLILRHQCVCGERDHADALCKQVCTSARQNHVGSLRFSMEANM